MENLEQILHNQARPANLAVVKRANTPVVAQPLEGAEVLFQADCRRRVRGPRCDGGLGTYQDLRHFAWMDTTGLRGLARRRHDQFSAMHSGQAGGDLVRQTKEEVGPFPGNWEPLDGKKVKIIWVQPLDKDQFGSEPKWNLAKSVFRKADTGAPTDNAEVAGVVVIFDSQDGGMAAATLADLQQWRAGHLSDDAFWKRCWRDPAEAFKDKN